MSGILAQAVLSAMLVVTCAWCAVVARKLRDLRLGQAELVEAVGALNQASERAESAISGLRRAGVETEQGLATRCEEAAQRSAEISRLVESATRLLKRLEPALHMSARAAAELRSQTSPRAVRDREDAEEGRPARTTDAASVALDAAALRRALEGLRR